MKMFWYTCAQTRFLYLHRHQGKERAWEPVRFAGIRAAVPYPPPRCFSIQMLTKSCHDLGCLVDVDLRIRLRDLRRTVTEDYAGRVQASLAADLCCLGMAELVGVPVRHAGPLAG